MFGRGIVLKSSREIDIMAEAGRLVAGAHEKLRDLIKPGLETAEIDCAVLEFVTENNGICTFKGYRGFPFNTCVSLNNEVVHGFPLSARLEEGDIVSVDVGVTYQNYVGDSAVTYPVGQISAEAVKLLRVTRECLAKAIEVSVAGNYIRDISAAVQNHAESAGFSVVRKFVGHGIGRDMHEKPDVPNFVSGGKGARLSPGMVLAIEPMVNVGNYDVNVLENGWTVVTADGSLSAHFEHSVAITEDGPRVLTRRVGEENEDF